VKCFRFIGAERANRSISLMCRLLGVSRSGFHAWGRRPPSDRDLADAWLVGRIREIHAESRETYGARRVHRALRHRGVHVGRKRVERLMRRERVSGLVPKRYRRTTIRVPGVRVADDLVDRDFRPTAPNLLWCADIKYVRTWQGWLYLAAVMDCYSRRIVGWSMRTRPGGRARHRRPGDGNRPPPAGTVSVNVAVAGSRRVRRCQQSTHLLVCVLLAQPPACPQLAMLTDALTHHRTHMLGLLDGLGRARPESCEFG
jgi:HTH-like domain/Integrase core domain